MTSTRGIAPSATPVDRAAAIVRAWVGCYTIGLSAEIAMKRKELVEADLWDESREAEQVGVARSVARQRMGRLVRGIPADVSWRLERRHDNNPGRDQMRISKVELILLLGVVALCGAGMIPGLMAIIDPDPTKWQSWGPYGMVGGLALCVVGLVLAIPRPSVGLTVALAGTALAMAAVPWAFYIFLPVPLVAWFRYARSRPPQVGSASIG